MKDGESYEYEPDRTRLSRSLIDNLADFIFTWNISFQSYGMIHIFFYHKNKGLNSKKAE